MINKTFRVAGLALILGGISSGAVAGLAGSKHDFTSAGGGVNKVTNAGVEICAFCHTPHGGVAASAPLWNKGANTSASYDYYSTTGMDAGRLAVGSVSVGCLSCHDGTQAMDNMVNIPGSGGWDSTLAGTSAGYTWTGANQTSGKMDADAGVAFIGTDLRNDHPIGIAYCAWTTGATAPAAMATNDIDPATECNDKDFNAATFYGDATNPYWYLNSNGTAGKQKTDIVLYTREFGAGKKGPSVECASCHDPHQNSITVGTVTSSVPFLRMSNAGSAICLACHDK